MRVVIDTNVLLVSLPKHSEFRPIFDALIFGKIELIINNDVMLEYEEVISQKANSKVSNNVIEFLYKSKNVLQRDIFFRWNLIAADVDDNKFCDLAISNNADYLVSNDNHFDVLKNIPFPNVKVLTAEEFLKVLENGFLK